MANLNFRTVTISGTSYTWNVAANWDTGQIPVDNDQVTMSTGTPNLSAYTSVDDIASLTLNNIDISNGVTFDIDASAYLEVQNLGNAGSIDVDGTFFIHNINSNTGTIDIRSGGSLEVGNLSGNAFVIESGGTLQLDAGGNINGTPTFYLQGGLLTFLNNTGGNTTVDFSGGSSGHLSLTTEQVTNANSPTLANLGAGDSIEFGNAAVTAVNYDSGTATLTITADGTDYAIHVASFDGTGDSFILSSDPTTGRADAVVVCYLRGTRIQTPDGETPIEALRPGDAVATLDPPTGCLVHKRVRWVGSRRVDLRCHPARHTVAPIRIHADAFSVGVPSRDLLVSPDHGILVDGTLICARQLVNGASIARDDSFLDVEYFHVELDEHAILLAEGLAAESYLDTGNRGFFDNGNGSFVLHPNLIDDGDCLMRQAASCAPFVWDETLVLPAWQRLAERSASMGKRVELPETTDQAELRLIVNGRTVCPISRADETFTFMVPANVCEVRVVSHAAMPTDTRPWLEDRRRLGVYVKQITRRGTGWMEDIPLDSPSLGQGWWAVERDGRALCRWTSGDAVLRLPAVSGPCLLEVRAGSSTYLLTTLAA